ncbi:Sugar phosphate isomerase/epimerase [Bhargavaea ginsengi]|uniref:Sugar phosphate isomerase/epimerase n=1 Tax=Bhargavaea ginsengi TaxID=426757 RepID=A0A1H6TJS9_9BACL|nr:sugar phosphate isomerase/epimerase family protein [Bhargavaea ginsengi]SEI80333.1 Sugar phosphate isomerase/epimerase [Bhargavaea ginsengi]
MSRDWYGSSTLLWGGTIRQIADKFTAAGLDGVELWTEQFRFSGFRINAVKEVLMDAGLGLTLHAPSWDLNICSLNEGIREQSLAEIERSVALVADLGAEDVTIHPGRITVNERWTEWHLEKMQHSLDRLERIAIREGVPLSVEMMEDRDRELVTGPETMNRLVRHRSPFVTVTVDTAHVPFSRSPFIEMNALCRVGKLHVSDATANRFHVPLGKGKIDVKPAIRAAAERKIIRVIEGFDYLGESGMLKENVEYLKKNGLFGMEEIMHEIPGDE